MRDARYWIEKLQLSRHPEGGFFQQTYRADLMLDRACLPSHFHGDRSASTAIYFLLSGHDFSAFHRIASDEMWHFYLGDTLTILVIGEDGQNREIKLGTDAEAGELFQAVVPAGSWFASCLMRSEGFALVGCTVSPGFDFEDFELAERSDLSRLFPQHKLLIERFTREAI